LFVEIGAFKTPSNFSPVDTSIPPFTSIIVFADVGTFSNCQKPELFVVASKSPTFTIAPSIYPSIALPDNMLL